MTDLELKSPSRPRMKLGVAGWIAFALLLGFLAWDSDQRERAATEQAGTLRAAYERVCDAAHAVPGTCVHAVQNLITFKDSASALGSQDAVAREAMLAAARAEGRAEGLSERLPPTVEPTHAPPAARPVARRQRLDLRLCRVSGGCPEG